VAILIYAFPAVAGAQAGLTVRASTLPWMESTAFHRLGLTAAALRRATASRVNCAARGERTEMKCPMGPGCDLRCGRMEGESSLMAVRKTNAALVECSGDFSMGAIYLLLFVGPVRAYGAIEPWRRRKASRCLKYISF
jgi:hypothetical protein